MKKVNLLIVLLSGLRRRWFVYFRPQYTVSSLLSRKGKCQNCGLCCLLNKSWCRYLSLDRDGASEARRYFEASELHKQKTAESEARHYLSLDRDGASEARRYFVYGKCQIHDRQPFFCKIFPVDEKDKKMSGVTKECGYYWDGEDIDARYK